MNNQGKYWENLAAAWLSDRAVKIIRQNFQCKAGEIDLIAVEGESLVFVEVRSRSNPRFSSAAASVDRRINQNLSGRRNFSCNRTPGGQICPVDLTSLPSSRDNHVTTSP